MAFSAPSDDIERLGPDRGSAYGFTAGSAVTAGQVVKLDGDNSVAPADTAGETAIGVASQSVASGDQVQVTGSGARMLFTAGSAVSAGDPLTVDPSTNNGEVGTASTTGDSIVGYALEGASSQGDTFIGIVDLGGEIN